MNSTEFYCILIHYDEIAIKLGNRKWFEKHLIKNIKKSIRDFKYDSIQSFSGRIFINQINNSDANDILDNLRNVMGVSSLHLMKKISDELDDILEESVNAIKEEQNNFSTFKIFTKRQNKAFPKTSQ